MKVSDFITELHAAGIDYFTGVPDSLLKPFCDYLNSKLKDSHISAHNEGGAVALAAGYHLATGKTPCVYMQNSGIGNAANPIISLTSPEVYGIPVLYVVGWRGTPRGTGEPGVHDEPQHMFQGKITLELLKLLGIETVVIDKATTPEQVRQALKLFAELFRQGKSAAFVAVKDTFAADSESIYTNKYPLSRERAVEIISGHYSGAVFVSTTGKISRELYEIRERRGEAHASDFLTVGSMGHSSMLALGIALNRPDRQVVCLDGDGALLMHMGALVVIGKARPLNFTHFLLNNEAHESVGGMPNASDNVDFCPIARACGYDSALAVSDEAELMSALGIYRFVEVRCALGSRGDLGRPKESPAENKAAFVNCLTSNTS
jgi:phosphonopyruvate decarboxylase